MAKKFKDLHPTDVIAVADLIKSKPEIIALMIQYRHEEFAGSYIADNQIETEQELIHHWLTGLKKQALYKLKSI